MTALAKVPVLIVGGGGVGLTASLMLADFGVEHLLVERRADTSPLPKAHLLNQRTMEIFRQHGVAESVTAIAGRLENIGKVRYKTSLAGDGPFDARLLFEMDAFGGGSLHESYAADGSIPGWNLAQCRLEPVLRRHAEERSPGRIRFAHEIISLEDTGEVVRAEIRDLATDEIHTVEADYVIGADGGRAVGAMVGIYTAGLTGLVDVLTTHFSADLSAWWDDDTLLTWFLHPAKAGPYDSGCLAMVGPTWGRASEEWNIHFTVPAGTEQSTDAHTVAQRVRALFNIPDLELTIHRTSRWSIESVLADHYRRGRVFVVGDAAHRHSPATGLGLNTGVQDAHNLVWKLAAVLKRQAGNRLLDTYEAERRPVGARNVGWATFAAMNQDIIPSALGIISAMPPAVRELIARQYFDDTPMGRTRRARAAEIFRTQRITYQAHDLELGFVYETGAVLPDGTPPPPVDPMGSVYTPTARPGHRLPHAWLQHEGVRASTHDLVGNSGRFAVLAGPEGHAWEQAAEKAAAKTQVPVEAILVQNGTIDDRARAWLDLADIGPAGAVLVRPDNHVAWRRHATVTGTVDDLTNDLVAALQSLMDSLMPAVDSSPFPRL